MRKYRVTEGTIRLRAALAPTMNQSALAKRLGVEPQAVSNWVRGYSSPKLCYMAILEELLGIPVTAWLNEKAAVASKKPRHKRAA